MEINKITLPDYTYLVNLNGGRYFTNDYSGSVGTVSGEGCLGFPTFNYYVHADVSSGEEEEFRFFVRCYALSSWKEGGKITREDSAEFPYSPDVVSVLEKWLTDKALEYQFI